MKGLAAPAIFAITARCRHAAAIYKLLSGLLTLLVSIVCTFVFVFGCSHIIRMIGYELKIRLLSCSHSVTRIHPIGQLVCQQSDHHLARCRQHLLWTAAAGVNRQDEVSAAARAGL